MLAIPGCRYMIAFQVMPFPMGNDIRNLCFRTDFCIAFPISGLFSKGFFLQAWPGKFFPWTPLLTLLTVIPHEKLLHCMLYKVGRNFWFLLRLVFRGKSDWRLWRPSQFNADGSSYAMTLLFMWHLMQFDNGHDNWTGLILLVNSNILSAWIFCACAT